MCPPVDLFLQEEDDLLFEAREEAIKALFMVLDDRILEVEADSIHLLKFVKFVAKVIIRLLIVGIDWI